MSITNHTVEIWRAADTKAGGITTRKYYRVAFGVACYIEQKSGAQVLVAGQERAVEAGEALFDRDIGGDRTILEDDQIRWEGRTLRVESVHTIRQGRVLSRQVKVLWREADNAER